MSEIDWSRPIEAVHPDGRVVAVLLSDKDYPNPDADGDYVTEPVLEDGSNLWNDNGINWSGGPWRIRNVAQSTPERDPMRERLEELARKVARIPQGTSIDLILLVEARAIVAALSEPVDPDLVEARRIVGDAFDGGTKSLNGDAVRAGARDNAHDVQLALAAIKRGRELERESC